MCLGTGNERAAKGSRCGGPRLSRVSRRSEQGVRDHRMVPAAAGHRCALGDMLTRLAQVLHGYGLSQDRPVGCPPGQFEGAGTTHADVDGRHYDRRSGERHLVQAGVAALRGHGVAAQQRPHGVHALLEGRQRGGGRGTRSAWAAAARTWITDPTREGALLLSSIVADSRPITEVTIGRAVTDTIRETTRSAGFLDALLRFTLAARPPVGFIRDFVVEHSGEHRGGLDLKRGGLLPISALARWLAIVLGEVRGSTPERLSRAAAAGLLSTDEAETLAGAFKDVYELLLRQEVAAIRDGRPLSNWIAPRDLDPLTRRHLRDSFRAISTVQAQLESEWKARMPPV
jgi:hypothetical protein